MLTFFLLISSQLLLGMHVRRGFGGGLSELRLVGFSEEDADVSGSSLHQVLDSENCSDLKEFSLCGVPAKSSHFERLIGEARGLKKLKISKPDASLRGIEYKCGKKHRVYGLSDFDDEAYDLSEQLLYSMLLSMYPLPKTFSSGRM